MTGKTQENPWTVSALALDMKGALEGRYSRIFVEGEISGFRPYPSGHAYFTLKDAGAQLSCAMFRSSLERCRARASLKDGAKVVLYCNATMYPQRGSCQLVVLAAKLSGEGDLMQKYLELKAKLEAEGLFSPGRKKPLPFLPRRIGLVTSSAGAVVHDMCRVLTRRFPALEIRIFPAAVQGAEAPQSVKAGVEYFNAASSGWRADLLIVARGGGSFEDLFCFSDERLVRAVAASEIPVVSAVGHETDFTLCDFAADVRAGTPSIAAEIAVPELAVLQDRLSRQMSALVSALRGKYESTAQRLDSISDSLAASLKAALAGADSRLGRASLSLVSSMKAALADAKARLERCSGSLAASLKAGFADAQSRMRLASEKLRLLSPFSVLERGYTITSDSSGRTVRSAAALAGGDEISTRFPDGTVRSVIRPARAG